MVYFNYNANNSYHIKFLMQKYYVKYFNVFLFKLINSLYYPKSITIQKYYFI